ncbi:MAG: gamma-glutamyltransferase [Acidobacteria bacterium]|nr:gamma-glutamyltransferase [Acidobacteriota bacterium]
MTRHAATSRKPRSRAGRTIEPARLRGIVLLLAAVAGIVLSVPSRAAYPPAVRGVGGAVASAAQDATTAGIEMLGRGGNAVDAAVATALVLAVVHPEAGNLGGGGFAVVRMDGRVYTLDFRETAPAAATSGMFLDRKGRPVAERSLVGPLAAGVPGSPAGLWTLHHRFGKLPWPTVVAPAMWLARDGFVVSERLARDLEASRDLLARFPETAAVWLPGGTPPAAGTLIRLPELAALLEAYSKDGPNAITGGPAGAAIELASRRHGGVLRAADLAAFRPVWRNPVRFAAWGWEVASMDLPSSGGILLGESAGMLQRLHWERLPRFGARADHLLVEAWRRAYADRFLLGDPLTCPVNAGQLLSPAWLDRRARSIDPARATPSEQVGPWPGAPSGESRQTTHLSTADAQGNVVSLTTTLNGLFGCGLMVPGVGIFLNNEMDDFAAAPGQPNQFGLIQGKANAVAPGRRMLSSMSPTVAWKNGQVIALGSPGGSRIPTATLQALLNFIVYDDGLQAAVDRPRLHHQWQPDRIDAEPDALAPETADALRRMGHRIRIVPRLGRVNAVRVLPDSRVEAAADPRGPGFARVVAIGRSPR